MKKFRSTNTTTAILVIIIVVILAYFLFDGGSWINGMHRNSSLNMGNLHWGQILIGLAIGFLLGIVAAKRRW